MMTQVKIFQATNPSDLEKAVNDWLLKNANIQLQQIAQSQVQHGQSGPMPITISVWYDLPEGK